MRQDRDRRKSGALSAGETQLDLSGIGVGYGFDRTIAVLQRAGISRTFVDVSGDCFALGESPRELGWLIIKSTRIRSPLPFHRHGGFGNSHSRGAALLYCLAAGGRVGS